MGSALCLIVLSGCRRATRAASSHGGHTQNRPALQFSRYPVIQAQAFGQLFLRRKVVSGTSSSHLQPRQQGDCSASSLILVGFALARALCGDVWAQAKWVASWGELGAAIPIARRKSRDLVQAFGVSSIPATYLIDPEGTIIRLDLRGKALDEALARLLKRPAAGAS